jgi:hypothetical protein
MFKTTFKQANPLLLALSFIILLSIPSINAQDANHEHHRILSSLTCSMDTDCSGYPYIICDNRVCAHKQVFPILPLEFAGFIILPLILMLCSMAGIGGGMVDSPACMAFYQFSTKNATALSNFILLFSSVARFIYNINQKHPDKDAVVIDYALASVMLPTVLMGSFIGVIINTVFPSVILTAGLTVICLIISIQAAFKAYSLFKKESILIKQKQSL